MQLTSRRAIRAKIETTEGADAVPTGADNAILCMNVQVTPLAGGTNNRPQAYPSFGATPEVHKNKHVMVSFDVELCGSGTAGTPPAWGPLERMCGLAETIVSETSVAYTPISTGQEAGSIYANEDGTLHKLVGARGNRQVVLNKDEIPVLRYSMIGRWTTPAAAALPALTLTAHQLDNPLVMNKVNTPTFSLHTYAAVLENLTLDLGNKVIHRDRPNAAYVAITGRESVGSALFEAPALATKNYFAIAEAGTVNPLALVHGTAAGNIVTIGAPKAQVLEPSYQDVDNIKHLQTRLKLCRNAGDDELTLTLT